MVGLVHFSQDIPSNDVAAPPINWVEGQPANSVNNSAKAMMAALANWHADTVGANAASGGAGNGLVLSTAQGVDLTVAFELSFTTDATNTGPVGLSVDGSAARPLQRPGNVALAPGDLVAGPVYKCRFLPTFNRYILVSPIPEAPGRLSVFATEGSVPPGWVICDGRLLSRSTYAALYAALGSAYGSTDSTNFRVPDLRGRTAFGADAQGGSPANRLTGAGGVDGTVGKFGGAETVALTQAQMPSHSHTGSTSSAGGVAATTTGDAGAVAARTTGASGAHNHTGTTDSAGSHSHTGTTGTSGGHVHSLKYDRNTAYGFGQDPAVTVLYPPGSNSTAQTESAGEHTHSLTTNTVAAHSHGLTTDSVGNHSHSIPAVDDHSHSIPAVSPHSHTVNLNSTGGGEAHSTMPPALVLVWAIKA